MSEHDKVRQFHEALGLPVKTSPKMPDEATRLLRCRLLLEETMEYIHANGCSALVSGTINGFLSGAIIRATHEPDLAAMAQENADVRYIAHGNDLAMGVDGRAFDEVHRANMEKFGPDGRPIIRNGKVQKPEGWTPPDVAKALGLKP